MQGATEVGIWVLVAIMLLPAIKTLVDWGRGDRPQNRQIEPQPLITQERKALKDEFAAKEHSHTQYLTREECGGKHTAEERRIEARITEIKEAVNQLGTKLDQHNDRAEERAAKIHARVDGISNHVSGLSGQLNNHIDHHPAEGPR